MGLGLEPGRPSQGLGAGARLALWRNLSVYFPSSPSAPPPCPGPTSIRPNSMRFTELPETRGGAEGLGGEGLRLRPSQTRPVDLGPCTEHLQTSAELWEHRADACSRGSCRGWPWKSWKLNGYVQTSLQVIGLQTLASLQLPLHKASSSLLSLAVRFRLSPSQE